MSTVHRPERADQSSITCPVCRMTSYNPNDIKYGYCGNCHRYTGCSVCWPTPTSTEPEGRDIMHDLRRWLPPTRPAKGRRTAPGYPLMALFRWSRVIVQWAILFSLPVLAIILIIILT